MNKEEIYNFCKNKIKKENIEFTYVKYTSQEINLNKFNVDKYTFNEHEKLFIRSINKGSIGQYSVQEINPKKIEEGIKKAKKIALLKKSDVIFKNFGSYKTKSNIKFDKNIEKKDFSKIITEVKNNITKEKYFTGYDGGVGKYKKDFFYINPFTEKESEKYILSIFTGIYTKNKKKSQGCFSNTFTKYKDIDIEQNFNQAKFNANLLLDPIDGNSGEYTLILTPEVTKSFINFILSGGSGDLISKKNSFLHNQINKPIFSKELNINEEPHLDYFLMSSYLDDEGFKTKEKEIIKNGAFKSPIYNLYNSIKYNKRPTGNGFLLNGYSEKYTNKIQKPGKLKINDIISKIKKGILVYNIMGLHTNKITTGDFSLTISIGKKIENGSFKETITNLNFSGNLKEVLKEAYFSKEQKFFGSSLFSFTIIPKIKLI